MITARKVTFRTAGLLYSGAIGILFMIMTSCGSDPPTEPPIVPVDTTGPVVILTNPAAGASIGDTVTLRVSSPDSLDIDRVKFRVDNNVLPGGVDSIAPYEFQWVAINMTDGQLIEFSAQAFDKVGNSRDPDIVSVTYRWAVIESLTNPTESSSIGDTVTLRVSSPDSLDIDRVEFRVDNLAIPGGVDSIAPYEFQWVAQNRTDGQSIEFSAQAFDKRGNTRDPDKVTVNYRWAVRPSIVSPSSDAVVSNLVSISGIATPKFVPIDFIEFLRDGVVEPGSRSSAAPYTYLWDASISDIGSIHLFSMRAVDQNGNSSVSTAVRYHYLWRLLLTDPDEAWPRDINTLSIRSTSTQLQFRVTTNGAWTDYRSPSTGLAFVVFLDTDQDPLTGRTGFEFFSFPINDIGAEYRLQLGAFGDSISVYDAINRKWQAVRQLTSVNVIAPANDSVFELRINLSELGTPSAIDIVTANIFQTTNSFSWDFAPDQGNGHVTYLIDGSFTPAPPSLKPETSRSSDLEQSVPSSPAPVSSFR